MRLPIKVTPNSKKDEIIEGNPLIVKVREKAENNKANIAIVKLLSKHFNSKVKIVRGLTSRKKIVEVG